METQRVSEGYTDASIASLTRRVSKSVQLQNLFGRLKHGQSSIDDIVLNQQDGNIVGL